jgi:hypothetical protein
MALISMARPSVSVGGMKVVLPAQFSKAGELPLKINFKFDTDEVRHVTADFLLLAEDGSQVAAEAFVVGDNSSEAVLSGKEPVYSPTLRFDPYTTQIVGGARYQLVCVIHAPNGLIAGSAWFTLNP